MLIIDDKEFEITESEIKVGSLTVNGDKGYDITIGLKFTYNNITGYLHLDAGFEKSDDIKTFVNREYIGIPFENDNQYIYFEIFDTEKFLDTQIESKITLKISEIFDNKVRVIIKLNDDFISLKYDDFIGIN
ncbi:MAG: hypothetical protein J1F35_04360 [Erysipelotrichales bacterium]|nr:hypothetical protein [Erysipelotrichales bacterium]